MTLASCRATKYSTLAFWTLSAGLAVLVPLLSPARKAGAAEPPGPAALQPRMRGSSNPDFSRGSS